MTTFIDGARNPILFLSFSGVFLGLLAAWLISCFQIYKTTLYLRQLRPIYMLLSLWLLFTWAQVNGLLGLKSINPYLSAIEFYLYAGYAASLLLLLALLRSPARILWMVAVTMGVAIAQTLFGMINYYSEAAVFGWAPTHYAFSRVTGSFANRNFYANLVAMSSGFALVWVLVRPANRNSTKSARLDSTLSVSALVSVFLVILFSGILLSGSRSALLSFAGATVLVVVLAAVNTRLRLRPIGLILICTISVVLAGTQLLSQRFSQLEFEASDRLEQWRATIDLASGSIVTGFGAGTYETVFRSRKVGELGPMTYNHAHNDYLELALEQGAVGLLLVGLVLLFVVWVSVSRLQRSRSLQRKRLILTGLFGVSAICFHALVDFPFQVPANVWIFISMLAITISASKVNFATQNPPE
ncbi:MAG: O-antigen ligase family protein [bacterium]